MAIMSNDTRYEKSQKPFLLELFSGKPAILIFCLSLLTPAFGATVTKDRMRAAALERVKSDPDLSKDAEKLVVVMCASEVAIDDIFGGANVIEAESFDRRSSAALGRVFYGINRNDPEIMSRMTKCVEQALRKNGEQESAAIATVDYQDVKAAILDAANASGKTVYFDATYRKLGIRMDRPAIEVKVDTDTDLSLWLVFFDSNYNNIVSNLHSGQRISLVCRIKELSGLVSKCDLIRMSIK